MSGGDYSREYYEQRMDQLDDQMLDSTRRSRQRLEEAHRMGIDTAVELDEQGEKLSRAERRLDDIDEDLRTSQRTIRQIRSVFGGVVNWFTTDKLSTTPSTVSSSQAKATSSHSSGADRVSQSAGSSHRTMQQQEQRRNYRNAKDQEVDENLSVMSDTLGVLKNLGQDMGQTLQDQNDQIERTSGRVRTLDGKVEDLNKQTRRLH
eukprot:scpid72886/ scgid35094/ Soluable nsf attachment protein 29